jgi:hypothetical protein
MNTANANKNHANNAFFLSFVSIRIDDNNNNITANAQGFILSAKAAGIITPKNDQ